jgi:hypothetical protein
VKALVILLAISCIVLVISSIRIRSTGHDVLKDVATTFESFMSATPRRSLTVPDLRRCDELPSSGRTQTLGWLG